MHTTQNGGLWTGDSGLRIHSAQCVLVDINMKPNSDTLRYFSDGSNIYKNLNLNVIFKKDKSIRLHCNFHYNCHYNLS